MKFVADLHLHSKYSRAVSQNMTLANMALWAKYKGISVLATGDFTHPFWFEQLKSELVETGNGLFKLKSGDYGLQTTAVDGRSSTVDKQEIYFLLSCEISSIYSQGGKTRRIHNLFFFPKLSAVEKFNRELLRRGSNLRSDGRPIVGITSRDLVEIALSCDEKALVVPAHCLPPDELIHTRDGIKRIDEIKVGDRVYTHKNRARKVTEVFKRNFEGNLYHVRPWYFSLGTKVTGEHPFYAFKTSWCKSTGDCCLPSLAHKRRCKHKLYEKYKPEWIPAEMLEVGDILTFPRFKNTNPLSVISLESYSNLAPINNRVFTGGTRGKSFAKELMMTKELCRLVGYYLAEGYTNGRDEIGFTFHRKETAYISDVIMLMEKVFGFSHSRVYLREGVKGAEISFYSKLLVKFFTSNFYVKAPYRANTKTVPDWMLHLPEDFQAEILRGWWRGDQGYTTSRHLMAGMKVLCLRLGIIPSITEDSLENHLKRGNHVYQGRIIKASSDLYSFRLAFFDDSYNLLSDSSFSKNISKLTRRHGWIDENYIYLPIRAIDRVSYKGDVFNLEVEEDNSYLAEFAAVHNCWTPWFSVFGSFSGFDSIEECFGDMAKNIYGIETGLSSDPAMNWQIGDLDGRAILSFSDAHSLEKMGREATVFEAPSISYQSIFDAIKRTKELFESEPEGSSLRVERPEEPKGKIAFNIEFYPEEGKYHFTGHRDCNFSQSPEESKKSGDICPVCRRPLTVGVMHRVEQLKTRNEKQETRDQDGVKWVFDPDSVRPPYVSLVPLYEILSEALSVGVGAKKTSDVYLALTSALGSEFSVLTRADLSQIRRVAGDRVAEAIAKVRARDIVVEPGYDGKFGVVKIWSQAQDVAKDAGEEENQLNLFV